MKQTGILELLGKKRLYFDGATGTELQKAGLIAGESPELMNLRAPEAVEALHRAYYDAGADIIKTNTFGANRLKFDNYETVVHEALSIAKRARGERTDKFIALDIGPTGRMLAPLGDLSFEDAVEIFAEVVRAAEGQGADLILIETMSDTLEMKAAVIAAKENSTLPVFVTCVYDGSGKMLTGGSPEVAVAMLEGLGVDALGMNCSLGPDKMAELLPRLSAATSLPIILNPNAGLPEVRDGEVHFSFDKDLFASYMRKMASECAVMGGCCGTSPEYIKELVSATKDIKLEPITKKTHIRVTSFAKTVDIGERTVIIGERINPTGKKRLKEALRSGDTSYILEEAVKQGAAGAHILDVNVGLPEIDERLKLCEVVTAVQTVSDLPIQIDTASPAALEAAMRIYNGKPLVNSVNGSEESMNAVFPLVKKYGGAVIALTLDGNGIPKDSEGRIKIAERIIAEAEKYGIEKKDIIVDPLALAVSAEPDSAQVTLRTVKALSERGIYTSLGVSNVSFGLPRRDIINSAFFSAALSAGLNVAIINPLATGMMNAYFAHEALFEKDERFNSYIAYAASVPEEISSEGATRVKLNGENAEIRTVRDAIINGLSDSAKALSMVALQTLSPMEIIEHEIIPALGEVGRKFERSEIFLPALLTSAEAALCAFGVVRERIDAKADPDADKKIVLATVEGDMHDIGKNIVRVILESHGYRVYDLGRNVPAEKIVEEARRTGARLVGLSALMTTTVPAMERTVKLLRSTASDVKVMVGGAVMNSEYAEMIGADYYAEDAMAAASLCKEIFG